ncbi:MAG: glycosyltransferase family 2 protein [Candidatus Zixiibacteriota bacterium]
MQLLRVSVIIPTFNRAHLIARALNSAQRLLVDGDEIIVVDDDSKDNTEEIVRRYGEPVRYFRIPNNGAGRARNFGVGQSRNELVAFLDSDDEWMPHKLQLQRAVMQARPDLLFCFSNFAVTDTSGRPLRRFLIHWNNDHRGWDEILGPGFLYSSIGPLPEGIADFQVYVGDLSLPELLSAYVLTSSMVARKAEAGDALHFAEDVATYEDLECFGRLSLRGKAAYLDTETTWQHGHSGERLTDNAGLKRSHAHVTILERVWGSDRAFMEKHGEAYRRKLAQVRLERIADLIAVGQTGVARNELHRIEHAPLSYRLMAGVPGPLARNLFRLKRALAGRRA